MGYIFTHKFECHIWYDKLLLCNFKDSDIARCNENNSESFFLCYFKEQRPVSFQITQKKLIKKNKKNRCVNFFNRDYIIFQYFFVIFLWSDDLEQVTPLSVWLGLRRKPRVYVPGVEEAENYWHFEYVKTSVDKKKKFRKIKSMQHMLVSLQ